MSTQTLDSLLRQVADQWVAAGHEGKVSLARLGRLVVNDTSFFSRLENPRNSTTLATVERFAAFLLDAENWPKKADGPTTVPQEARDLAHRCGVSLEGALVDHATGISRS